MARDPAKDKAYREANKDRINARRKLYREANKEKLSAANQTWREENREYKRKQDRAYYPRYYAENRASIQARAKERRYGLPKGGWSELYAKQNGICPVCGNPLDENTVVDHNHQTGAVRGLLHNKCNVGIGLLGDNPDGLLRAYRYLTSS